MMKAAWKVDHNEEAVYIDGEEDEEEEGVVYSQWPNLPDLLLEEIFSYLTIRERYYASMVCRSWYRAFHLQKVWSTFVMEDHTLTRRKFNYYYGWQVLISPFTFAVLIYCILSIKSILDYVTHIDGEEEPMYASPPYMNNMHVPELDNMVLNKEQFLGLFDSGIILIGTLKAFTFLAGHSIDEFIKPTGVLYVVVLNLKKWSNLPSYVCQVS